MSRQTDRAAARKELEEARKALETLIKVHRGPLPVQKPFCTLCETEDPNPKGLEFDFSPGGHMHRIYACGSCIANMVATQIFEHSGIEIPR
jgi:hypothetical protein